MWLKDNYEYQAALAGNRLRLPLRPAPDLLAELGSMLMVEGGSGLRTLFDLAKESEAQGQKFEINPYALRDDPQKVPFADKRQILDVAVAAWKRKKLLH